MHRPFLFAALLTCTFPAFAQTLEGFATLPAETYVPGPTSGSKVESKLAPFMSQQPIQGFSSLWRIKGDDFWALEDNGFGTKANSTDFLLRIVRLNIDLRTRRGGKGTVQVESSLLLRDTRKLIPWPLVREDRSLTGADFDPESMVVAPDGTFWIGDEFGPFLLHFDRKGVLMQSPSGPEGVISPDSPQGSRATTGRSRGFEGMGFSPEKQMLYPILEGALNEKNPRLLPIHSYDLASKTWGGQQYYYPLEPGEKTHSIGDMIQISEGRYLVIERDDLEGEAAQFKRIYEFDAPNNTKKLVADLLNIKDEYGLAGDKGSTYRMPFQTIESVQLLDKDHILVCNDNNFPFGKGRGPLEATEFVVLKLDSPL